MTEGEPADFDLDDYLALVRRDRADSLACLKFLLEEARRSGLTEMADLLERAIPEVEAAFAKEDQRRPKSFSTSESFSST